MKNKQAPLHRIPVEVYKLMFLHRPDLPLGALNGCLKGGIISSHWKVAKKGASELPSVCRPLCMLDTARKVLGKLFRSTLSKVMRASERMDGCCHEGRGCFSSISEDSASCTAQCQKCLQFPKKSQILISRSPSYKRLKDENYICGNLGDSS